MLNAIVLPASSRPSNSKNSPLALTSQVTPASPPARESGNCTRSRASDRRSKFMKRTLGSAGTAGMSETGPFSRYRRDSCHGKTGTSRLVTIDDREGRHGQGSENERCTRPRRIRAGARGCPGIGGVDPRRAVERPADRRLGLERIIDESASRRWHGGNRTQRRGSAPPDEGSAGRRGVTGSRRRNRRHTASRNCSTADVPGSWR